MKISLKFVPKGPINNIPALVQIMAWCWPGNKPLSEPMTVSLLTHICVTRPQWVNLLGCYGFAMCDTLFPVIALVWILLHIDGLVQARCNSSALAMELHLSCTNPSICFFFCWYIICNNIILTYMACSIWCSSMQSKTIYADLYRYEYIFWGWITKVIWGCPKSFG